MHQIKASIARSSLLLFSIVATTVAVSAQAGVTHAATGGFRGVPWGSSRSAVLNSLDETDVREDDGSVSFWTTVADFKTLVIYFLSRSDELYSGTYNFDYYYRPSTNVYYYDYELLTDIISDEYGPPLELFEAENDLWPGGPTNVFAEWDTSDATIKLVLVFANPESGVPIFSAYYDAKAYHGEEEARRQEQNARDF